MYFCVVKKFLLPVALCECETWFLTLTREQTLGMCENRLHRNIFGPNTKEVRWKQRKQHTGEFHDLSFLPNIIWVIKARRIRWAEQFARIGENRKTYRILVGKD